MRAVLKMENEVSQLQSKADLEQYMLFNYQKLLLKIFCETLIATLSDVSENSAESLHIK